MGVSRRTFIKIGTAAGTASNSVLSYGALWQTGKTWPSEKIANIHNLKTGEPVRFEYPDAKSPAVLVKLGKAAYEGIGPDRDIVAFSALCTHMGCPLQFERERFVCPCHKSMYDPAMNGQVYQGLSTDYLPQIQLSVDSSGDIHADRIMGLVWGRTNNLQFQKSEQGQGD
jgi:arsenite oxidase small subunit